MRRIIAPFSLLLFLVVLLAPSIVLLQFKVDQARIARELCVQRELMEGMRTCHGECQLSKRLMALEEEAEAGFPADRVKVRLEPVVDFLPAAKMSITAYAELAPSCFAYRLLAGHGHIAEPVPWV